MIYPSKIWKWDKVLVLTTLFVLVSMSLLSVGSASADDCLIPPIGPWPSCVFAPVPEYPIVKAYPDPLPPYVSIDLDGSEVLEPDEYVRIVGVLNKPSDSLRLEWSISANWIVIERIYPSSGGGGSWQVVAMDEVNYGEGSQTITHSPGQSGLDVAYKFTDSRGKSSSYAYITLPCEYEWNPSFGNHSRCAQYSTWRQAFHQNFEGGLMVWLKGANGSPDSIIVSSWDGVYKYTLTDNYIQGVDPVSDPTFVPPPGLYQPKRSVGKIWRENPEIRNMLGWATDWGGNYTANKQGYSAGNQNNYDFMTLRDQGGYILFSPGTWTIHYPQP